MIAVWEGERALARVTYWLLRLKIPSDRLVCCCCCDAPFGHWRQTCTTTVVQTDTVSQVTCFPFIKPGLCSVLFLFSLSCSPLRRRACWWFHSFVLFLKKKGFLFLPLQKKIKRGKKKRGGARWCFNGRRRMDQYKTICKMWTIKWNFSTALPALAVESRWCEKIRCLELLFIF